MKKVATNKFKAMFEEQKQKLVYSGSIVNEQFHVNQDDLSDETDITAVELETSMRMRLRNREALYIRKLNEALERIAAGTFGECESCGEDIESRRLEARPTATHCVSCKEEQERLEQVHVDSRKHKSLGVKLRLA